MRAVGQSGSVSQYDEFGGRRVHCSACGEWTYVIDPTRSVATRPLPPRPDAVVQEPDGTFPCAHCGAKEVAINWVPLEISEEDAVILEDFLRRAHEDGKGVHSDDPAVLSAFWPLLGALEIKVNDIERYDEILAKALKEAQGAD